MGSSASIGARTAGGGGAGFRLLAAVPLLKDPAVAIAALFWSAAFAGLAVYLIRWLRPLRPSTTEA